jgi:membrane-associated phospholipid phosphatase
LVLAAIDAVWFFWGHWSIAPSGAVMPILVVAGLCYLTLFSRFGQDKKSRAALICSSYLILFSIVSEIFSYLVVGTNAALVDPRLAQWDQMLNFDWPAVFLWVKNHRLLDVMLAAAYKSALPQICLVILYLALADRHERLSEFNGVLVVALLVTIVVSGFFPAAGPFKYYSNIVHADISPLTQFEPLRDGSLRIIDLRNSQGLISMPSFHAILAILFIFTTRGTRIFIPTAILNAVVLASTPTCGGHYLVDLFGGAVTVAIVIVLWNCIRVERFKKYRLLTSPDVAMLTSNGNVQSR